MDSVSQVLFKFFVIDLSNTLRCFSLDNGEELWNVKTQNSLIRTQKKLSMTIINNNIFLFICTMLVLFNRFE